MQLDKHPVLKEIYDVMGLVEELGASPELTEIVCRLGGIGETVEKLVDSGVKD